MVPGYVLNFNLTHGSKKTRLVEASRIFICTFKVSNWSKNVKHAPSSLNYLYNYRSMTGGTTSLGATR